MSEKREQLFEAWKKRQKFQLTYLCERLGRFSPDVVDMCQRAFDAGLDTCTCGECIKHNPNQCFDVEAYYV